MSMIENSLAPPTRFDLNFRIGDIPVRVHPFFWLGTVLMGLNSPGEGRDKLIHLLIWIAIVFVSILIHEMGHVLMGRFFGCRGQILLTGFCGLAIGSSAMSLRWQRNLVYLAGPGAGFLFAALVVGVSWLKYPEVTLYELGTLIGIRVPVEAGAAIPSEYVLQTIYLLLFINIFWGLVNLLPIWPLDGGQICRETCRHFRGADGMRLALLISFSTAIGFALLALLEVIQKKPLVFFLSFGGSLFPVVFFGLLAVTNWQLLQAVNRYGPDFEHQQQEEQEPREPWEQDPDWWKSGGSGR